MDHIRKASSVRGHRFLFVLAIAVLIGLLRPAPSFGAQARPERAAPPIAIDYTVRRLAAGDRYEITMRFRGDHSGRSTLTVPSEWASATHAERGIERLEVLTPGARILETETPAHKRVLHRPDAMLTVRYVLKQIQEGEPAASWSTQFLPVIRPGYFAWIGMTAWIVPGENNGRPARIHVAFVDLPPGWAFASSYGLDATKIDYAGPIERFQSALFIAGDFRLRSRPGRGGSIVTAMRGDWSFGDNELADRMARIVDAERSFWRDDTQRYYLVALLPLVTEHNIRSMTGTGLSQSFVSYVTTDTPLDALDFLWTHEYFHQWNSAQLGTFPEPEAQLYWFSEGFTDYYTNLLQLRLRLKTLEQYAATYDEALGFLAEAPEGRAPNAEVVRRFFTDGRTYGRLPYYRGMLLAAAWNAQIRTASNGDRSLDDAMRQLRDEHLRGVEVLDVPRIVRVMQSFGVVDAAGDIETQIEHGDAPRLADGVLTACISTDEATEPRVDIGFDLPGSTKGGPIVGVDPDGPAYAAGMRNGQRLRSFRSVDPSQHLVEAGFETTPESPITTVRYRALGRPITRQHVAVRGGLDDATRSACLAALGVH